MLSQSSNAYRRPKVSVIIPTCNARASLARAVRSVIQQAYDPIEIIVVDDNQSESVEQIAAMLPPDSSVRVIRNSGDHGPSQARNKGAMEATGQLLTFLDDDDIFLPGRLESMVELYSAQGQQYSFISSGRIAEVNDFADLREIPGQSFGIIKRDDLLLGNSIDISVLMETQVFHSLGGFDEDLSSLEDWDLFLRALDAKDGFKIHRFDYVVNHSEGRERVSGRESRGYFDMSTKYRDQFGMAWSLIMEAKGLKLAGELSLRRAANYSFRSGSLIPLRMYLASSFPRLIRLGKKLFGRV